MVDLLASTFFEGTGILFWDILAITTFFYINRRKYWFCPNFWLSVFDGFTRFGIPLSRFDYFWKIYICLSVCLCLCTCDKIFVASIARELIHIISWNFRFWIILLWISVYRLLEKIAQQVAPQSQFL